MAVDKRGQVVAENSTFVAPQVLRGHRLWSYARPGTVGYVNPEGVEAGGDTAETLIASLRDSTTHQTLDEHVRDLAQGAGAEPGSDEWVARLLAEDEGLADERRTTLAAWAAFAQRVAELRAEWLVLDFSA
jgi:hypothetical protein